LLASQLLALKRQIQELISSSRMYS